MKTLDEVIKALSIPAVNGYHYIDSNDAMDALQYLKWYKELADASEAFAEWRENQPLTWQELTQMLGKPVWVEHKHYSKWLIVYEVYESTIVLDGNGYYTQYFSDDNDKEVRWKAYRKER